MKVEGSFTGPLLVCSFLKILVRIRVVHLLGLVGRRLFARESTCCLLHRVLLCVCIGQLLEHVGCGGAKSFDLRVSWLLSIRNPCFLLLCRFGDLGCPKAATDKFFLARLLGKFTNGELADCRGHFINISSTAVLGKRLCLLA